MQDIIVFIIGFLVFGYLAFKVYKTITRKQLTTGGTCGGCTGCALKEKSDCTVK